MYRTSFRSATIVGSSAIVDIREQFLTATPSFTYSLADRGPDGFGIA